MITVRFDGTQLMKTLNNAVAYSHGFLEGTKQAQVNFNKELGLYIKERLYKYIDSQARIHPERLHHVYEWGEVGNPSQRLFTIDTTATYDNIKFDTSFIPSKSISKTSNKPFVDKASIMENKTTVTISPKNSKALFFTDNGQDVFSKAEIVIDTPGGDAVAGSFEETVQSFFNEYLTNSIMQPIYRKLSRATEFKAMFAEGTKIGKSAGIQAGKQYLSVPGGDLIEL